MSNNSYCCYSYFTWTDRMTSTHIPRRTPKQRRSQDMCDRIIDAAARVFEEEGYARGTTNRIAEEAGISIGSLYQYYPNKDVLLAELVRRHIQQGADEIGKRLAAVDIGSQSLVERTRMFVEATVALHRNDVALHRVLFEESPRPLDVLEELRQFEAGTVAAVELLIAQDPEVRVGDAHMAAYITVSTIESVTHHYASAHPHDADWDAFTDELVRLVVGYLASGATP
jgi:AcrR family transcriptional regulator